MIREEIVSKRYANAFLAYAKETIGFVQGLDELHRAKRIMRDNPNLKEFLESPAITNSEKDEVVNAVFKNEFNDELIHFLKLLIEAKRIDLFVDIAEYTRIHYAHGAEADTLLKTSYPLETNTLHRIKNALEQRISRKIHLYIQLDADLVGGAYAQIGNLIIDGSVKKRLEDMKKKLDVLKVV
ncbi:MAG: ATP synthase F1 subunit delta [Candidatus Omnitrophica bacterium]|nr:ATP synthase F1 subunit delta [Candidatus Omnitrophota bacterium]